ncbi:MAG TPA: hypothetical protein DCQ28_11255 [Bacteroidetes bacterium]|nr:hypothetical protein [Bacteroidota bacterium]
MHTMKKFVKGIAILFFITLFNISCIDRDTIAGTGKETPDIIIAAGGNSQFGIVNYKLPTPLKVRVLAANGRPVRGIIVEFSVENSNAIFSDTSATTNADGYAQTTVTLGAKADSIRISASVFGLKGSPVKFTLLASASSAATIEMVEGNNQTGNVGDNLPTALKVKVSDFYNNPVPNSVVYFSTNNGTVQPSSALTDSLGIAFSFWKLDTIVGNKKAQALISSISNGTINFNATALSLLIPSYFSRVSNEIFYSLQGTTINNILRVNVLDKFKNPVYRKPPAVGIFVKFDVRTGLGTVSPNSSPTGSTGDASASVILDSYDSIVRIAANVGFGFPEINFTVFAYKYCQIDSLKSSGGLVTLYWQKNLNPNFANYTLQRCNNFNFDGTTIDVKVISDENVVTTDDNTAVIGSSPFYRMRFNYTNGFYFYTNLRDVTVNP